MYLSVNRIKLFILSFNLKCINFSNNNQNAYWNKRKYYRISKPHNVSWNITKYSMHLTNHMIK